MRYALIEYGSMNIIIQLDQDHTFSPEITNPQFIDYLPDFCNGLINYQNNSSLLISLSTLLGVNSNDQEVLLHSGSTKARFSLKIPLPKVIERSPSDLIIQNKEHGASLTIPSGKYVIVDSVTHMFLSLVNLTSFISDQIDNSLSNNLTKRVVGWDGKNYVKEAQQVISTQTQREVISSAVRSEQTIICKIADYYICFNEMYSVEILSAHQEITELPNSANWVVGLFDYIGESIVLLDLRKYFDIGASEQREIIVVVKTDNNDKFAFIVDNISSRGGIEIKASMFDEIKFTDQLLFTNISITSENQILFFVNFDQLILAINNELPSVEWSIWRENFTYKKSEIEKLRKTKETKLITDKFAAIKYPGINILLDIGDTYSLHTAVQISEYDFFPKLCTGIGNIEGNPVIVINFADLLQIPKDESQEKVYIFNSIGEHNYYAFEIPVPVVSDLEISSDRKNLTGDNSLSIISGNYVIINNEVYLRITSQELFAYLENELGNILSQSWQEFNFESMTALPIESNTIQPMIDRKIINYEIEKSKKYISFAAGDHRFCIEESQFIELISLDNTISIFPNSNKYFTGLINYNGNSIPILDISEILGSNTGSTDLIVLILKSKNEIFGIIIDNLSFKHIEGEDYVNSRESDIKFIYKNILFNEDEVIFLINVDELLKWIHSAQIYDMSIWKKYITITSNQYLALAEFVEKIEIIKNYIGIVMLEYTFIVNVDNILQIRNKDARIEIKTENLVFVNYNDQWIPSIELNKKMGSRISLIIKSGDLIVELLSSYLYFENINDIALDEKMINKLYSDYNYFGVEKAYVIEKGVAFELNINNLVTSVLKLDLNSISKIKNKIKDPIPQEDVYETLLQIWQDDIDLLLIIEDKKSNTKAIRVNQIQEILFEVDGEYIPWEGTEEFQYIFISTKGNDNKMKYFQIPTTCYLRPIPKIKEEDQIILEDEPVEIINLNK
jgi:chemotaxis signal transduction protein